MGAEVDHGDPLRALRVEEPHSSMGESACLNDRLVGWTIHPPLDGLLWGVVRRTGCCVDDLPRARGGAESGVCDALAGATAIRACVNVVSRIRRTRGAGDRWMVPLGDRR